MKEHLSAQKIKHVSEKYTTKHHKHPPRYRIIHVYLNTCSLNTMKNVTVRIQ